MSSNLLCHMLHHPTLSDLIEGGIAPDVHTLLERVPEDHPTTASTFPPTCATSPKKGRSA